MPSILPCSWPLRLTRLIFLKNNASYWTFYDSIATNTAHHKPPALPIFSFWSCLLLLALRIYENDANLRKNDRMLHQPLTWISCRFPAKLLTCSCAYVSTIHSWHEPGKLAPSVPPSEVDWLARVVRSGDSPTSVVSLNKKWLLYLNARPLLMTLPRWFAPSRALPRKNML